MRRLLAVITLSAWAASGALGADGRCPELSKADKAFLALLASGEPVPGKLPYRLKRGYVGTLDKVYAFCVLDEETAVVSVGSSDYLLRGAPTAKVTESRIFTLPNPNVAIVELGSYTSVTQSKRTLPVIDVVDMAAVQRALEARPNPAQQ